MADVRGKFVWHELVTPNAAGAHDFYGNVVGWKKQSWEHDPSYSMFVAPSGPLGAAVEKREAVPHWLPYVGVPDVDAAVDTAGRLGAKVLTPPTDVPNAGRHAVLADPQGGTFAVHSSSTPPSPERPPAHGEFSWHELATTADPADVFPFYAELFDWDEMVRHDMGEPMGTYLIFGRNGAQLGGMFDKGSMGRPGPAYWLSYVTVPDLEGAVGQAKARRGSVLHGPADVPGGDRIAQIMDPHGAFFALHWSAGTPAAPPASKAAAKPAKKAAARRAAAKAPKAAKKAAGKPRKKAAKKASQKAAKKAARKRAKKTVNKRAAKPLRKKVRKTHARKRR